VREKPDVIIMDLELPGKSGYEVARDLKARPDTCAIPLIAATGYSHVKQLDLARASGFDAVMVKPCDPQSLVAEIRRCCAKPDRLRRRRLSNDLPFYGKPLPRRRPDSTRTSGTKPAQPRAQECTCQRMPPFRTR
jgi:DNA-binding response OmpR family regulator